MNRKVPLWADLLLTFWVLLVAVLFFGPSFLPVIGLWTGPATVVYLVIVMITVVTLALRFLHRSKVPAAAPPPRSVSRRRK
jgi:cytosine/uracil/thiamine/allantoin permease